MFFPLRNSFYQLLVILFFFTPAIMATLTTDQWHWFDVYATSFSKLIFSGVKVDLLANTETNVVSLADP